MADISDPVSVIGISAKFHIGASLALSTGVATVNSLAQIRVQYTEKQRQRRCDDVGLTESRNTRSEQLLVILTESLTD